MKDTMRTVRIGWDFLPSRNAPKYTPLDIDLAEEWVEDGVIRIIFLDDTNTYYIDRHGVLFTCKTH